MLSLLLSLVDDLLISQHLAEDKIGRHCYDRVLLLLPCQEVTAAVLQETTANFWIDEKKRAGIFMRKSA